MSITEADNWLKGFTAWFDWNAPILDKTSPSGKLPWGSFTNYVDKMM